MTPFPVLRQIYIPPKLLEKYSSHPKSWKTMHDFNPADSRSNSEYYETEPCQLPPPPVVLGVINVLYQNCHVFSSSSSNFFATPPRFLSLSLSQHREHNTKKNERRKAHHSITLFLSHKKQTSKPQKLSTYLQ